MLSPHLGFVAQNVSELGTPIVNVSLNDVEWHWAGIELEHDWISQQWGFAMQMWKSFCKAEESRNFVKGAITVENHSVLPGWGDNMKTRPGCIVVSEEGSVD